MNRQKIDWLIKQRRELLDQAKETQAMGANDYDIARAMTKLSNIIDLELGVISPDDDIPF